MSTDFLSGMTFGFACIGLGFLIHMCYSWLKAIDPPPPFDPYPDLSAPDYPPDGLCNAVVRHLNRPGFAVCEKPTGHLGHHSDGMTTWREVGPLQNRP